MPGFLIPTAYWIQTRIPRIGQKLQYVLSVLIPQAIAVTAISEFDHHTVWIFMLWFVASVCVYELGYLNNDFVAQPRERKRGLIPRKPDPSPRTLFEWALAIAIRLSIVAAILAYSYGEGVLVWWVLIWLTVLFLTFFLHNLIFGFYRIYTFFLLYCCRLSLPFVVALVATDAGRVSSAWIAVWVLYVGAYSGCHAFFYGAKKEFFVTQFWILRANSVLLTFLATGILIGGLAFVSVMLGANEFSIASGILSAYCIAFTLCWSGIQFVVEYLEAKRRVMRELTHTHSLFSHDASITRQEYGELSVRWPMGTIYLTDHAEDFDEERYLEMKDYFKLLQPRLLPGLEYSVHHQHVLAHEHDSYVDVDPSDPVGSMLKLREKSTRLVWAHPRISMRRLGQTGYLIGLLTIGAAIDGVEVFNPKNSSKFRFVMEMLIVGWLCCLIFGRRMLFIGMDCHNSLELSRVGVSQGWLAQEQSS